MSKMPSRRQSNSSSDGCMTQRSSLRRRASRRTSGKFRISGDGDKISRRSSLRNRRESTQKNFLEILRQNSGNLDSFRKFLQTEYSHENLDFWLAAEEFTTLSDKDAIQIRANEIYQEYIKIGAPNQVNLSYRAQIQVKESLADANLDTFALAQREIYKLIEHDSYRRYVANSQA